MKIDFNENIGQILSWLTNQISDLPDALFPYKNGWRRIIPNRMFDQLVYAERFFFVSDKKRLIIFLIYDEAISLKKSGQVSEKSVASLIKKSNLPYKHGQYIIICDKSQLEHARYMRAFNNYTNSLLVYDYGNLYFADGSFQDKTLHSVFCNLLSVNMLIPSTGKTALVELPGTDFIRQLMLDIIQNCIYRYSTGMNQISADELLADIRIDTLGNKYKRFIKNTVHFILKEMAVFVAEKMPNFLEETTENVFRLNFTPEFHNEALLRNFVDRCASNDFLTRLIIHQTEIENKTTG